VNRAPATSCANLDTLSCYCGTQDGQLCLNTPPATLTSNFGAQCVPEILAGTNCTTSTCAVQTMANPGNSAGRAIQYALCQQSFCFEQCFNF
jgi:hypothetical protein